MSDLNVTFAGLALSSPLFFEADASQLRPSTMSDARKAGACAIVLPAMTDETLGRVAAADELTENNLTALAHAHAVEAIGQLNADAYFALIEEIRSIEAGPVVVPFEFTNRRFWTQNAHRAVRAGADALELRVVPLHFARALRSDLIEKNALRIVAQVADQVDVPLLVRIPTNITGLVELCQAVVDAGAKAVVFEPCPVPATITINPPELRATPDASSQAAIAREAIEAVRNVYRRVNVHMAVRIDNPDAATLASAVCCGATAVVGRYPQRDATELTTALAAGSGGLAGWMKKQAYDKLYDFRGVLSESRLSSSLDSSASEKA